MTRSLHNSITPLSRRTSLRPVIPDSLHRTAFHGLLALGFLFGAFGLFFHIRVAPVIIPCKILRRGFTTQVSTDALIVDLFLPSHVFRVSVRNISHNSNCPHKKNLAAGRENIKPQLCEKQKSPPRWAPPLSHQRRWANSLMPV